jgi:O-antigen ligase
MLKWISEKINPERIQLFLIHLLALTLPFSIEAGVTWDSRMMVPTEPLMLLLAAFIFIDLLVRPGSLSDLLPRSTWLVVPFIAALLLGTLFSQIRPVSVKFTLVNLLYLLVFFFALQRHLRHSEKLFIRLVALYTAGFLLIAILAVYRYGGYQWNPAVVKGIFQPFYKDHTIFGATAAILSAFWLSLPLKGRYRSLPLLRVITGVLLAAAVFLSYSRAALLSLGIFLIVRVFFALRIRLWQLGSILAILLIYLALNMQPILNSIDANRYDSGDRQSDIVEHTLSAGNVNTDISNRERLNRWVSGLAMFREKPATGFGPGTYQFTYIPYQKPELMTRLSLTDPYHIPDNSGGTAHSEYILALSESGITGILAWIVLIGGLFRLSFRKNLQDPGRGYVVAAFAALSTYFFHALFNNFLNTDKFAFLFWGLIAWICVVSAKYQTDGPGILR